MTDHEKELTERVMKGDMDALRELCPNMDEKTIDMIEDAFKFANKHNVPVDAMLLGLALSNVMPLSNLNKISK